jgi:hypothetical protein
MASSVNFDAGSYGGDGGNIQFYKLDGGLPFYDGAGTKPFYTRDYDDYNFGVFNNSWATPSNLAYKPGTRWVIQEYAEQGNYYKYEGRSPDQPIWPESMNDNIWPEDMSQPYWPSHMDWEEIGDGIPFYDDVVVDARMVVPYQNTQTQLDAVYLALITPKQVEEIEDFTVSETSGDGDRVTLTRFFNKLLSVNITITGGASAAFAKVGDKTWNRATYGDFYGPEVFLYDKDGNRTTGTIDVQIIGY